MNKKKQKQKRTINITVYIVLRFLVIVCMTGQVIRGNWNNVFLCFLTLLLFTIPTLVDKALKINKEITKLYSNPNYLRGKSDNIFEEAKSWIKDKFNDIDYK